MGWLQFDSLVNARDVGGTALLAGGHILPGRLVRSDNLQDLTDADVDHLVRLGVTDVVDLRSAFEVASEGPGPLVGDDRFCIHHYSFFVEKRAEGAATRDDDGRELPGDALPYDHDNTPLDTEDVFTSIYLGFLAERPDSVVGALRAIAYAPGAVLVHCAAGKDRTGVAVALAMMVAGAVPEAVVADYAASSERVDKIMARLRACHTYRDSLAGTTDDQHMTHAHSMRGFLDQIEQRYGSVAALLNTLGWSQADTVQMRAKLTDPQFSTT